jgi:hypothetical protein
MFICNFVSLRVRFIGCFHSTSGVTSLGYESIALILGGVLWMEPVLLGSMATHDLTPIFHGA